MSHSTRRHALCDKEKAAGHNPGGFKPKNPTFLATKYPQKSHANRLLKPLRLSADAFVKHLLLTLVSDLAAHQVKPEHDINFLFAGFHQRPYFGQHPAGILRLDSVSKRGAKFVDRSAKLVLNDLQTFNRFSGNCDHRAVMISAPFHGDLTARIKDSGDVKIYLFHGSKYTTKMIYKKLTELTVF